MPLADFTDLQVMAQLSIQGSASCIYGRRQLLAVVYCLDARGNEARQYTTDNNGRLPYRQLALPCMIQ